MRAIISGYVTAVRTVDVNNARVGQIDLFQSGTDRLPAKVLSLFISSRNVVGRLIAEMDTGADPVVHFLCNLVHTNKEIQIEVLELLEVIGGEDLARGDDHTIRDSESDSSSYFDS